MYEEEKYFFVILLFFKQTANPKRKNELSTNPPKRKFKATAGETSDDESDADFDTSEKTSYVNVNQASFGDKTCYVCNFPLHPSRYPLRKATKQSKTPAYQFLGKFRILWLINKFNFLLSRIIFRHNVNRRGEGEIRDLLRVLCGDR